MKKIITFFVLALPLSACGAVFHGPTQEFTLLTPGAENARCMVYNDDHRYEMHSGETRDIMRSEQPLNIDCYAPGNRQKSVVVDNDITLAGMGNIATAGAGAIYDYYDNSLFGYPSEVTVSFTDVPVKSYGLPKNYAKGLPKPLHQPIESYESSTPIVDGDAMEPVHILQKKERVSDFQGSSFFQAPTQPAAVQSNVSVPASQVKTTPAPLPAVRGSNAEELTRNMNPQVFQ